MLPSNGRRRFTALSRDSLQSRVSLTAAFVAAGICFAFLESLEEHFKNMLNHEPGHFGWIFRHMLPPWLILAFLAPFVVILAKHLPLGTGRTFRSLAIHLVAAPLFVVAHLGTLAIYGVLVRDSGPGLHFFGTLLATYSLPDMIGYWAICGSVYAWEYHRRLREREKAALELRANLSEARLQALRLQLNPHFLYNALNTVGMLMRDGNSDGAVRMLAKIGDLLRYVLRNVHNEEVPLGEEVAFLKEYMEVEQIRFGDRLRFSFDVESTLRNALVPRLLLQPLLENAVRHGIGVEGAAGQVRLSAQRMDGSLLLTVEDDGAGLPSEHDPGAATGLGLSITRQRLQQLYGTKGYVLISNRTEGGVTARITMPFRTATVERSLC